METSGRDQQAACLSAPNTQRTVVTQGLLGLRYLRQGKAFGGAQSVDR